MVEIRTLEIDGYEKVVEGIDEKSGLHCFIAVHDITLGQAIGGTRIYPYKNREDALTDALLLARAMTYKSALVEEGLGGGKAVIIADPATEKTDELLLAFAEVVDSLGGDYHAAEDVGSNTDDILTISRRTPYVAALPTDESSGDPSRFTAWGVFRGIQAVAQTIWGSRDIQGKRIAIQGIGNVGEKLARMLFWHGAELTICDVNKKKVHEMSVRYGGEIVPPEDYVETECDILCPCAMGGVINAENIHRLKCQAIAGSANNQLESELLSKELKEMGILYAPDYVINAGGVINAATEFDPGGYDPKRARTKVEKIYDTLIKIFAASSSTEKTTSEIADEIAEYNIKHGVGKRNRPLKSCS